MSLAPFPYGETIQRRIPVMAEDGYGDPRPTWPDPPNDVPIEGVGVEPSTTTEEVQPSRDMVTVDFTLYLPYGTEIDSFDRVVVRGKVCEVYGHVAQWRHPMTGWTPGAILRVKIVEG